MGQDETCKSIKEIEAELSRARDAIIAKCPRDEFDMPVFKNSDLAAAVRAMTQAADRLSNADADAEDSKSEMRRANPRRPRLVEDGERPQASRQPDNIIQLFNRLSDGREIKTDADFQQWMYESLEEFSQQIGMDWIPIDIFPAITRVMVEWCEATRECNIDNENAQALARAIGALNGALERCLADLREEKLAPPT